MPGTPKGPFIVLVLPHAPVAVHQPVPTWLAQALFRLPCGISRQFCLVPVKPAYLGGLLLLRPPFIGLLELLGLCRSVPELLAPWELTFGGRFLTADEFLSPVDYSGASCWLEM
jgi:hypothetical protein